MNGSFEMMVVVVLVVEWGWYGRFLRILPIRLQMQRHDGWILIEKEE